MVRDDYYKIALDILDFLEDNLESKHYNVLGSMAEQIAENMLKSVLNSVVVEYTSVSKTHHLRNIYIKIQEAGVDLGLDTKYLCSLKDVYFETRYPGENYREVTYDDCVECMQTMYDVVLAVNKYREFRGLQVKPVTPKQLNDSEPEDSIDNVFIRYRQICGINDDAWVEELGRLFKLFNTTNMSTLAEKIKETFL